MKRASPPLLLLVGVLGVAAGALGYRLGAAARQSATAAGPVEPLNAELWSVLAAQYAELDAMAAPGAVVYLGDSLTHWALVAELLCAGTAGNGRTVLNRGISGDTTTGLLRRVERSLPPEPVAIVLLVGHNDIARGAEPVATAARIAELVHRLRAGAPRAHVVVETLPPAEIPRSDAVRELNRLLRAQLAQAGPGVSLLDLEPLYLRNGARAGEYFAGPVHWNAAGIRRRLEAEVAHLQRVAERVSLRLCNGAPPPEPRGTP